MSQPSKGLLSKPVSEWTVQELREYATTHANKSFVMDQVAAEATKILVGIVAPIKFDDLTPGSIVWVKIKEHPKEKPKGVLIHKLRTTDGRFRKQIVVFEDAVLPTPSFREQKQGFREMRQTNIIQLREYEYDACVFHRAPEYFKGDHIESLPQNQVGSRSQERRISMDPLETHEVVVGEVYWFDCPNSKSRRPIKIMRRVPGYLGPDQFFFQYMDPRSPTRCFLDEATTPEHTLPLGTKLYEPPPF